jgi:hypothetical protein
MTTKLELIAMHKCTKCGIQLSPIETVEGELCSRCEVLALREFKRRYDGHLMKLIGGPVYKKHVENSPFHGVGCVLNFV